MRFRDMSINFTPDWEVIMPAKKLREELPLLNFNGNAGWYLCDSDTVLVTHAGRAENTKFAQTYTPNTRLYHVRVWNSKSTAQYSPVAMFHAAATAPVQVDDRTGSDLKLKCGKPARKRRKPKDARPWKYTIYLYACGPNRIAVIKAIRSITPLGLKEAKELTDMANPINPPVVFDHVAKEVMLLAEKTLIEAGAVIVTQKHH